MLTGPEADNKKVPNKIRAGLMWLVDCVPRFTGSRQITVHFQDGKPKKVERSYKEHENIE